MEIITKIQNKSETTCSFTKDELIELLKELGKIPKNTGKIVVNYQNDELIIDYDIVIEKEIILTHKQIAFLNTPILELVYAPNDHKLSRKTQLALKSIKVSTLMQYYECDKVKFALKPQITKPIVTELVQLFKDHQIEFKD